jgi:hypothetical protein
MKRVVYVWILISVFIIGISGQGTESISQLSPVPERAKPHKLSKATDLIRLDDFKIVSAAIFEPQPHQGNLKNA